MSADPQNPFSRWWWLPSEDRNRFLNLWREKAERLKKEDWDSEEDPFISPEDIEAAIDILETIAELGPDDIVQLVAIINAMKNK